MLEYEVGHRESVKREGEGKERRKDAYESVKREGEGKERRKDAYERRAREREEKGCI